MFNKILIANRGEIACRIIKTARSMGIETVAIYSSVDKDSTHVHLADTAYWVGEAPAKDSYLNIEAIIAVAQESGAQAIHPGYGFLSENPAFAKACAEAHIVFIGPSVSAMEAMASKLVAKQLLEKTTVPLIPGYHGNEQSEQRLLAEAQRIGFPVLLKAANGGGGKGMRAVYNETEFSQALASAKRESLASFADDVMIIEKLVLNPRHIEVQIMADNRGNVVHLFERDCSIQRRHQKIIEEAPAPHLSTTLREQLAQAACEVARSIHYQGAGTVEFLVDGNQGFYFMEMNTRLQVEHPVTELITGLDLVAWQFKIAANEPLPLAQENVQLNGHAIECRIYAEDPFNGFIPSIGQVNFLEEPIGEGIRIDTGIRCSSAITMYYDPMIAKLITWGSNREEALQRMQQALSHYFIGGLKTNIPFLKAVCRHPSFNQAKLSTHFLDKETIQLERLDKELAILIATAFDYVQHAKKTEDPLLHDTFAWQMHGTRQWVLHYQCEEQPVAIKITPINRNSLQVTQLDSDEEKNGTKTLEITHMQGNQITVTLNKQHYKAIVQDKKEQLTLYTNQGQLKIERFYWHKTNAPSAPHKGQLTAPMPATVVAILKQVGDTVKAGERLMVLEAMKMEHTIHAPTDGVLSEVFYPVGTQVNEGAELVAISIIKG